MSAIADLAKAANGSLPWLAVTLIFAYQMYVEYNSKSSAEHVKETIEKLETPAESLQQSLASLDDSLDDLLDAVLSVENKVDGIEDTTRQIHRTLSSMFRQ